MKLWIVQDDNHLWAICQSEQRALEVAYEVSQPRTIVDVLEIPSDAILLGMAGEGGASRPPRLSLV